MGLSHGVRAGVLKTDIHPTLPKVTVLGNVEPQTLMKKLAKCGKTAEVWPAEPKMQEKEEKKSDSTGVEKGSAVDLSVKGGGNEKAKDAGDGVKKSGGSEAEKNAKSEDKGKSTQGDNRCCGDGDKGESKAQKEAGNLGSEVVKNVNPNCATSSLPNTVTALPQVNYVVNPSMVQDSGGLAPAYAPRLFYAVEPNYPAPVTYYGTATAYAPPPPCCLQGHCYHHSPPVYHCPPPPAPVPSIPPQFGDYFNDENTVGCNVM